MPFARHDLVKYKTSFRASWRVGFIEAIDAHKIVVRPQQGGPRVTIQPGKRGKVAALHGPALVEALQPVHRDLKPENVLRIVRTDGRPVPLQKDLPMVRSSAFLDFVRTFRCLGCEVPGRPVDAHHAGPCGVGQKCHDLLTVPLCRLCHDRLHDTDTLPGLDREQSELVLLGAHVALLVEYTAHVQRLLAPPATTLSAAERVLQDYLSDEEVSYVA